MVAASYGGDADLCEGLGDARAQHQVEKEMQELEALLGSKQHVEGQASGKE
jgi:hypothetical protein